MKPNLEKEQELVNELKDFLIDKNLLNLNSWKCNLEKFDKFNGTFRNKNGKDLWIPVNLSFLLNNNQQYFITFTWFNELVNNPKNKTQVTKNTNKRLFDDARNIWINNHLFNQNWIQVAPKVDTFKINENKTRIWCASFYSLINLIKKLIENN